MVFAAAQKDFELRLIAFDGVKNGFAVFSIRASDKQLDKRRRIIHEAFGIYCTSNCHSIQPKTGKTLSLDCQTDKRINNE